MTKIADFGNPKNSIFKVGTISTGGEIDRKLQYHQKNTQKRQKSRDQRRPRIQGAGKTEKCMFLPKIGGKACLGPFYFFVFQKKRGKNRKMTKSGKFAKFWARKAFVHFSTLAESPQSPARAPAPKYPQSAKPGAESNTCVPIDRRCSMCLREPTPP